MIPWEKLGTAKIPGSDEELRLMRRGKEFSIKLGTNELMNNRLSGSEAALATLAAKQIETVVKPVVLIGGLGMGFTLRAALAVLGAKAKIVVSELVPAVVAWARGPMAEVFGDSLDDPRVKIRETDVGEIIRAQRSAFDAILLDVDNGPEGLTRKGNDALYNAGGVEGGQDGAAAGWCARRVVVGAQPGIHQAPKERGFRRQRSQHPRHRQGRRRAPCDLDGEKALGSLCCRSTRVLVDGADDLGPETHRQRVAHAFDHQQLCAGN
ncbi:hypothetical protein ACVMHR_005213 [Bradyrhizobium diazoefficiens]